MGEFDPMEITMRLGLTPFDYWMEGDMRADGCSAYDFSRWSFGRCDEYDIETDKQIKKTIAPLLDKIDILNKIRTDFDVGFYIEVVPEIYTEEFTPALAPSFEVMDFCCATRTQIDIDLYVCE